MQSHTLGLYFLPLLLFKTAMYIATYRGLSQADSTVTV